MRVTERIDPELEAYQFARAKLETCRAAAWLAIHDLERAQIAYNEAEQRIAARWWPSRRVRQ